MVTLLLEANVKEGERRSKPVPLERVNWWLGTLDSVAQRK